MDKGLLGILITSFRCLPGVGAKSAQRMAFHLLQRDRKGGIQLSQALADAMSSIGYCQSCRTFTEQDICGFCKDSSRDDSLLCIVESPADVFAIDQATEFRGYYHVLHGRLSPLDGIGPAELGLELLTEKFLAKPIRELILAMNSTVEGDATALYIAELASNYGISTSRLAYGLPLGGELEFVDSGTLAHAFSGRKRVID